MSQPTASVDIANLALDAITGARHGLLSDDDEARAHAGQARRLAQALFGKACQAYVREFSKPDPEEEFRGAAEFEARKRGGS